MNVLPKSSDNTRVTLHLETGERRIRVFTVMSGHLVFILVFVCLQTHRKLDGPADSERRGYGAVHWTTETVSINAFIWRGNDGRRVIDASPPHFSAAVLQRREEKRPLNLNLNRRGSFCLH